MTFKVLNRINKLMCLMGILFLLSGRVSATTYYTQAQCYSVAASKTEAGTVHSNKIYSVCDSSNQTWKWGNTTTTLYGCYNSKGSTNPNSRSWALYSPSIYTKVNSVASVGSETYCDAVPYGVSLTIQQNVICTYADGVSQDVVPLEWDTDAVGSILNWYFPDHPLLSVDRPYTYTNHHRNYADTDPYLHCESAYEDAQFNYSWGDITNDYIADWDHQPG